MSFMLALIGLTGAIAFTFLGAQDKFEKKEKYLRAALISETAVNIIAGVTYVHMLRYVTTKNDAGGNITVLRYLDWILTTPLLILSFAYYSSYEVNKNEKTNPTQLDYKPLIKIIILNTIMLLFGFLGENKVISVRTTLIGGFGAFFAMFYTIYTNYVKGKPSEVGTIFYPFMFVWMLYGIAFLLPGNYKSIAYNCLDLISKSGFGIFLWAETINRN